MVLAAFFSFPNFFPIIMSIQAATSERSRKSVQNVDPINTIAQLWQATIDCQTQGMFDTDAMYAISQAMSAKLTYQDLANVFSGVYADTYWNFTFMDESILAQTMIQTLSLSATLANQYATNAMAQWRGIFCRKNINDSGQIPVVGSYTESLDIICNGNTPINPQQLIQNWNSTYWQQPSVNKNYIYARCQNMSFLGGITKPVVSMFYTTGGFNQPPTSWIQCYTTGQNEKTGTISSLVNGNITVVSPDNPLTLGERAASEGFFFTPTSTDHVCVIAVIGTEFFTNNPLNITNSNWDSNEWITHNGAAAWHNVDPQLNLVDTLKFYNQDDTSEDFYFSALCRNVPVGTKISLKNTDAAAAFDTGVTEVSSSTQEIRQAVTLPAKYEGALHVQLEAPGGKKLPHNAAVEITMYWRIKPSHAHYAQAAKRLGVVPTQADKEVLLALGSFTIIGS